MRFVVIGGGPVGLFAATATRLRGHDVTVLERREGDGDKPCGEGLMPSAVRALSAIGVEPVGWPLRGIRYLDASGRHQVRADLVGGTALGVRRTELVRALREAADRVGVNRVRAEVVAVDADAPSVSDSAGAVWSADIVLACDGLGSRTRTLLGLDAPPPALRRYGLVAHFAREPWSSDVEVYWGRSGEAYVTPVGSDLVGVALLGERGTPFDERIAELTCLRQRLGGAPHVGRVLGAGPLWRRARSPVRARVALVGDAAGYVDALTGEGLAIGFREAVVAIEAAESGDLAGYAASLREITRNPELLASTLVRATRWGDVRRRLVPAAARAAPVFERLVRGLG
jgi:flavin-dependent dehydrogenase